MEDKETMRDQEVRSKYELWQEPADQRSVIAKRYGTVWKGWRLFAQKITISDAILVQKHVVRNQICKNCCRKEEPAERLKTRKTRGKKIQGLRGGRMMLQAQSEQDEQLEKQELFKNEIDTTSLKQYSYSHGEQADHGH